MTDLEKINEKYKNQEYIDFYENYHMKPFPQLFDINGLLFPFNPDLKNIGITFSGGADSTLLTYILCNLIQQTKSNCKIHILHIIRFYKSKWWIEENTKKIYNYFKEKFPDIIQDFNTGLLPEELEIVPLSFLKNSQLDSEFKSDLVNCDVFVVRRYEEFYVNKLNIELMYSGVTVNPTFFHEEAPKFRNANNITQTLHDTVTGTLANPFYFVMKDWIMAQYDNFHLHELLEMTRSCTADYKTLGEEWKEFRNGIPPVCGTCFFCKEREWGIKNKDQFLIK